MLVHASTDPPVLRELSNIYKIYMMPFETKNIHLKVALENKEHISIGNKECIITANCKIILYMNALFNTIGRY